MEISTIKSNVNELSRIYIYIYIYCIGVAPLYWIKNHNNKTLVYSLGVPKHTSKVLQVMGT